MEYDPNNPYASGGEWARNSSPESPDSSPELGRPPGESNFEREKTREELAREALERELRFERDPQLSSSAGNAPRQASAPDEQGEDPPKQPNHQSEGPTSQSFSSGGQARRLSNSPVRQPYSSAAASRRKLDFIMLSTIAALLLIVILIMILR